MEMKPQSLGVFFSGHARPSPVLVSPLTSMYLASAMVVHSRGGAEDK